MTREEAIKAIKAWDFLNNDEKEVIETLIPELKESDDDMIRKALIDYFDDANKTDENPLQSYGIHTDKAIAWLEKQGNKPFDYENANIQQKDFAPKVKPKFKIGDIISNGRVVYRVDGFGKNCVCNDSYFLVNVEMEKNGTRYTSVYDSNGKVHNAGEIMWLCDQVDQMFQKVLKEKTEPAWSEEDEKIAKTIINEFEQYSEWYCANGLTKEDCIAWLNKQMHTKWSEEDEKKVNNLYVLLDQMVSFNMLSNKDATEFKDWLESLSPQNHWKPSDEQMDNLSRAFNGATYRTSLLRDLYLDLKKLR